MIKTNSSLNIKGGKTLIGPFIYASGTPLSALFTKPSTVNTVLIQSDNKIVVGGSFTITSGSVYNRIARFNTDGTIDPNFNISGGFNNTVNKIIQQPDGKLVVVGSFTTYSGSTSNYIVRINPSGSRDTTFNIGTGFGNIVDTIAQQSDGKLVAGGTFTTYSGSTNNGLVRINSDGTKDLDFQISGGISSGNINSIIQQTDSKLVVGGAFTSYSGSTSNYIVRINPSGSIDPDFNIGTGFGSFVYSIVQQSDDKLVVTGLFTTYSGSASSRIVRINPSGSKDTTFNIGSGFNAGTAQSIVLQTDGKLVVGGSSFTTYSGSTANNIVRINPSGTIDSTFNKGNGFDNTVNFITQQFDGKIIAGGSFITYSGSITGSYDGLIRINTSGTIDNTFNPNGGIRSIGTINTSKILSNGNILIGGDISRYSFTQSFGNMVLVDSNFNPITYYYINGAIQSAIQQSDDKIVAVGSFSTFSGSTANNIVRFNLNGTIDSDFNTGAGFNSSPVRSVIQQSDGKIVAVGGFSAYSGSTANRIVRINPSGSIDPDFNVSGGLDSTAYMVLQQSDGKIVATGLFTSYSGSTATRIVRINPSGSIDLDFNTGAGFVSGILGPNTLIQQSDGKLVVVGGFTSYSGSSSSRIVRINPSGTRDTTLNIGTGFDVSVYSISQQPNGSLIAGGDFTSYSGSSIFNLINIYPSGTISTPPTRIN